MSHANARLTPRGREIAVLRVRAGWARSHVAAAMGCSRSCVTRWVERFEAEGIDGLRDRSSRPGSSPSRTPEETELEIVRLRVEERLGRDRIAELVGVSSRTVSRVLARRGAPPLSALDPMTGEVIRTSKQTAIRYERERPGELVHMDVKKLGRIPDGGGWRANGRGGPGDNRDRKHGSGYDYVHSLVDDHSRLAYSEILTDERGATCAGFLRRAAAFFAINGIDRIERLMTDNAFAYRFSLRDVVAELGARQVFIRPHCPWQNGKVERFNRTLQTEWAYRQPFTSNAQRAAA
ncbi:IS481 family transposase, partial [Agrococcus sp. HG114]|uniref:IS481 family transposase n=1 Tax=Agrococcus sp. HG114 TaxID=2969757 RepID=UPI00215A3031